MSPTSKTVIVTGANRGIGIQIVRHLAAKGYRVAACIRSRSDALDEIVSAGNGMHSMFTIDMSDSDSIKNTVKDLLDWSGAPSGLVNCAGMATGSLFSMTRIVDLQMVYQVNLFGPLLLTQYVVKKMLRAKSGSIVNIASTAGLLGDSGTLAYGGSKASLIHASRVMATELGAFGIRVNAIAPSVVETDMASMMDEQARAKLDNRSGLAGQIHPSDVADLAAFLLSPASSKITGQVIRIDRGMPF